MPVTGETAQPDWFAADVIGMASPRRTTSPQLLTTLLSLLLGGIVVVLVGLQSPHNSVHQLTAHLPWAVALCGLFFLAEQFLINVEFRRQTHSLTFASFPLALGMLLVPMPVLVAARLVGSVAAFASQRTSLRKGFYNTAAYAFEAAVGATIVHAMVHPVAASSPRTAAALGITVICVDQCVSGLVLLVIRIHGGRLSTRERADILLTSLVVAALGTLLAEAAGVLLEFGAFGQLLTVGLMGLAVVSYRAYARTTRRREALELVHEFVTGSAGVETVDDLAVQALTRMRVLLNAARCELLLTWPDSRSGPIDARHGAASFLRLDENDEVYREERTDVTADWVVAKALHSCGSTQLRRTDKDADVDRWLDASRADQALVVPLQAGDQPFGVVSALDRLGEAARFSQDDLTLLQTLAGHLAVSIARTRMLERLAFDASHDALTGLVNRGYLDERLRMAVAAGNTDVAMLLLDLDKFKEVNDVLGHDVGDRLLVVVAERLRAVVADLAHEAHGADRADGADEAHGADGAHGADRAVVARLGGDEFAVLLTDLGPGAVAAAEAAAVRVRDAVTQPVRFAEALLVPEVSVGVAVATSAPITRLLRTADTAMYSAKGVESGIATYTPVLDRGRAERLALLADLRIALEESAGQFVVYYQPKFDLQNMHVVGLEALIRWHHPELGTVSPDRFVPLAEASGMIDKLTSVVLEQAVAECAAWCAAGHDLGLAVNLSARNIADPGLPARIQALLDRVGLPSSRLTLEITESSVIEDPEAVLPQLQELAASGISISLDDFGTGYSSLAYLQKLPVSELKIDRSFVSTVTAHSDVDTHRLLTSIVALGKNIGLRIVAEGIETEHQRITLAGFGCDLGQGYLVSKPLSPMELQSWLEHRAGAAA